MKRSRLYNSYLKWPFNKHFVDYKKAKNLCNSLNKNLKIWKSKYLEKAAENGTIGSKKFWSTVKHFFSSNGFIHNHKISIEIDKKYH